MSTMSWLIRSFIHAFMHACMYSFQSKTQFTQSRETYLTTLSSGAKFSNSLTQFGKTDTGTTIKCRECGSGCFLSISITSSSSTWTISFDNCWCLRYAKNAMVCTVFPCDSRKSEWKPPTHGHKKHFALRVTHQSHFIGQYSINICLSILLSFNGTLHPMQEW